MGDAVGVFFAVFCLCSMAQLPWILRGTRGRTNTAAWEHDGAASARTSSAGVDPLRRTLLRQVYGHRADDLALPNFDALRSQSTLYTDAQPIGDDGQDYSFAAERREDHDFAMVR